MQVHTQEEEVTVHLQQAEFTIVSSKKRFISNVYCCKGSVFWHEEYQRIEKAFFDVFMSLKKRRAL